MTEVYTDGACQGNPGPGGWAWAVPGGRWRSGAQRYTTNQRMELQAVLDAVTSLDGPLEVVSDSTYVVNCFRDRWWEGWQARGWLNSAKKPVANRDLWEPLVDAYRAEPGRVSFRWVKGHSTDPHNDLVDRLAVAAAAAQSGSEGREPPNSPGPPDLRPGTLPPRSVGARTHEAPPGHLLVVTGLRPPDLGGWDENPLWQRVRRRLSEVVAAKASLEPDLVVLTGLGLGVEQLAAEAAAAAGGPNHAVLPCPGMESPWPNASRERFAALVAGSAGTTTLDQAAPANRQRAGAALARRDAWLAGHADEAVVVWDGAEPTVGRTVRNLQDKLGETAVWVLEP